MTGTLLNQRYQLDEELGRGSMGVVYRAHDLLLDRDVLVKVLSQTRLDEAGRDRLLREARATARLDHPNIISVYDAGEADAGTDHPRVPFIVMQYFAGKSLHDAGPLTIPQVLEIIIQICRALEHAHRQGIIHRDVKPENVIVAQEDGRFIARLTDFGLARSIASRRTAEGTIIGTVFYMAPEQALGKNIDGRADLYALGVMLYERVAGRLPFDAGDAVAVISQHLHAPPVPPSTYNEQIDPTLEALILRLLSKQPEDRPASAEAVRQALEEIIAQARGGGPAGPPQHYNLPTQLSSFIGRAKESAEVKHLLRQTRLLTLSGVGGTGKTRLALHCAAEIVAQSVREFEHGAWLVELARLTDPARILPSAAVVFGFYERKEGMSLETRLLHHLHDKRLLLILDNCEHLIDAAAGLVDSILRAAPGVKVMATSREALGLEGETIYLVPALSLPDTVHLLLPDELQQYDAVRLFVERAAAALPAFALTEANAREVEQICQRLDGIPLAIELAAARVKALSTDQICARLDNRFRLLTGGSRTALPRQQTLRATIDWSYGLLSQAEQALLRSLSVFIGGWTLEAAEAVCAVSATNLSSAASAAEAVCAPQGELEVLDGLALLVNKSLVEAELAGGEVRRYRLLETVRQYAQEKLDEAGDAVQARDRHLAYFLEVSKKVERGMRSFMGWELIKSLKVEVANFRSALGWAYGSGDPAMVSEGLQLASNIKYYFQRLNLYGEALVWVKKGLALLDEKEERFNPIRAQAFSCAAELSNLLDNNNDIGIFARESVNLYRRCKDPDPLYLGTALVDFANCVHILEPERPKEVNDAESDSLRQEGFALLEQLGEAYGLVVSFSNKTFPVMEKKDYAALLSMADEARTICQGTDYDGYENWFLAKLAQAQGDFSRSLYHHQKMLESFRAIEEKLGTCFMLRCMGDCAIELKQVDQAQEYYHESMTIARELGAKWSFTYPLRKLAEICISKGQYPQAGEYLQQGLTLAPEMDPEILAGQCLFPLLSAAEGTAPPVKLARLLGSIDKYIRIGDSSAWSEKSKATLGRITAALQDSLDPVVFQANVEAGRKLSIEQVQAEAHLMAREVSEYGKS